MNLGFSNYAAVVFSDLAAYLQDSMLYCCWCGLYEVWY